jgi:hypothetical protein
MQQCDDAGAVAPHGDFGSRQDRPTGGRTCVRPLRQPLDAAPESGWSPAGVRVFVWVLAAFQVAQGLADAIPLGNVRFTESYYLVTYNHGFVRRGLLGEVLRLLFGTPTRAEVDVTADLVVALAVGAVLVTCELLIRRRTTSSFAMAILLVASPFAIDFFIVDRRPDLIGVVLLVALGVALVRLEEAGLPWLLGFGIAFAALVLVHEDVILIQVPWAMVLVAVATLRRGRTADGHGAATTRVLAERLGALVAPSVVAIIAVLAYGLPSGQKVARLEQDVSSFHLSGNTVFTYLPESIHAAVRLVGAIPTDGKVRTLALGLVLVALQLGWVIAWVRPHLGRAFAESGHRALGVGLGALVAAATVVLFGTGFDWVRWFADCGTSWLVVQAFVTLLAAPEHALSAPPARVHLSHWLPALAVYLALVPPLDVLYVTSELTHFLLLV